MKREHRERVAALGGMWTPPAQAGAASNAPVALEAVADDA